MGPFMIVIVSRWVPVERVSSDEKNLCWCRHSYRTRAFFCNGKMSAWKCLADAQSLRPGYRTRVAGAKTRSRLRRASTSSYSHSSLCSEYMKWLDFLLSNRPVLRDEVRRSLAWSLPYSSVSFPFLFSLFTSSWHFSAITRCPDLVDHIKQLITAIVFGCC